MPDRLAASLLGAFVGTGLAVAGHQVGAGLFAARAAERSVTVRGLAEREVDANLALWPIAFSVTDNDLARGQARIDADLRRIAEFLAHRGFTTQEFGASPPRVTDRIALGVQPEPGRPFDRYLVEVTVSLRSPQVDRVSAAMRESGELVAQGVTLQRSYEHQTQYLFTDLDQIKPEMIAEATADARRAAQQFAADSGSRVGAIRTAQQGYFSIEDRDPFSPHKKRVRVVTTVQYLLVDE